MCRKPEKPTLHKVEVSKLGDVKLGKRAFHLAEIFEIKLNSEPLKKARVLRSSRAEVEMCKARSSKQSLQVARRLGITHPERQNLQYDVLVKQRSNSVVFCCVCKYASTQVSEEALILGCFLAKGGRNV